MSLVGNNKRRKKDVAELRRAALSATPNPYLVHHKVAEISGVIYRLTLGLSLPFGLPYAVPLVL